MKWANIIAIIVLALGLVGETVFLVKQTGDQQEMGHQVFQLEQEVQDAESNNEKLIEENNAVSMNLKKEIEQVSLEKVTLVDKVAALEEDASKLKEDNTKLTNDLKAKTDRVSTLTRENSTMKKKFMCGRTLSNVDFASNDTVNKALKQYVNDTKNRSEIVSASYWNLIWTGEKYSTHTVEVYSEKDQINYVWKFTVYFRGESYGDHENGIFYNDDQCWMYLDK